MVNNKTKKRLADPFLHMSLFSWALLSIGYAELIAALYLNRPGFTGYSVVAAPYNSSLTDAGNLLLLLLTLTLCIAIAYVIHGHYGMRSKKQTRR